jgi:hypothetical protein
MKTNLSFLYYEELWYQVGDLIQELIMLVKNCFYIEIKKNNLWNLYGKDLFAFTNKFTNFDKEVLPKISFTVLIIGATRFIASFNEDKIVFLEEEIYKNRSNIYNNFPTILFLKELNYLYSNLFHEKVPLNFFMPRILLKKFIISGRTKKFLKILYDWSSYSLFQKNFTLAEKKKNLLKNRYIKKNFVSRYNIHLQNKKLYYFEKNINLNSLKKNSNTKLDFKLFLIFHNLTPNFFRTEKEDFYFVYSFVNSNKKKVAYNFFNSSFKNLLERNEIYCNQFSILCFFSYKDKLRLSRLSKKLQGNKNFIDKFFRHSFSKFSIRLLLSQKRQIISIMENPFYGFFENPERIKKYPFEIQKILNKISILKKKIIKTSVNN